MVTYTNGNAGGEEFLQFSDAVAALAPGKNADSTGNSQAATTYADSIEDALKEEDADRVARCLSSGISPNTQCWGHPALSFAVSRGNLEIARLLIEGGAEVDQGNKGGITPLMQAAKEGRVEAMRYLISKGAGVNRSDDYGTTPLSEAAISGDVEAVRLLIREGADVPGSYALVNAAHNGHLDIVKELISNNARVDAPHPEDAFLTPPLHTAIERRHAEVVAELLASGADPQMLDGKGRDARRVAQYMGYDEIAEMIGARKVVDLRSDDDKKIEAKV